MGNLRNERPSSGSGILSRRVVGRDLDEVQTVEFTPFLNELTDIASRLVRGAGGSRDGTVTLLGDIALGFRRRRHGKVESVRRQLVAVDGHDPADAFRITPYAEGRFDDATGSCLIRCSRRSSRRLSIRCPNVRELVGAVFGNISPEVLRHRPHVKSFEDLVDIPHRLEAG